MELDHIFIFTHQAHQVATRLTTFGLSEGSANVHPGQGTACRRFFFQNAYLELVWIVDEEEVKSPLLERTNLWERSQYKLTRYCPFGLCFRTPQPAGPSLSLAFEAGWRYYSDYLPEGQYAHIASNEAFAFEPMLFEMPFFGLAPQDYPVEKQQPLLHAKGYQKLTKVTLTLPVPGNELSPAMQKVVGQSKVDTRLGESYVVALEFDGGNQGERQDFTDLIPLIISW
ncbi:VOC family protein [Spirosoma aerolatum]|uniref:VOC family protein n=1 Tax=Spirosoma aerolatum TaxID=1211326 RepID=UPI0009AE6E46|nr:VOC family protein [Spirosoma aerolatum]